jgi:DNA invertase Pin-like site-specific DNA recombinase
VDRVRAVEAVACPACRVPAGRACRTRSGNTASWYHTHRLVLIPQLGGVGQLPVPADRAPGAPWPPSTARPPAVRLGYTVGADRPEPALAAAGCVRTFVDEVAVTVAARPALDEALALAAEQRASAEHQPVILVVPDIARLARHSRELIQVAARLGAAGVGLQVLAGALRGRHDPAAAGGLFDVLATAAHLDRQYVAAKAKAAGPRGGRPRVVDGDLLAEARRLRDQGLPVPEIARRLVIPAGRNAGSHPSLATVYRALAEPEPIASPSAGRRPEEPDDVVDEPSGPHPRGRGRRPGSGGRGHRG